MKRLLACGAALALTGALIFALGPLAAASARNTGRDAAARIVIAVDGAEVSNIDPTAVPNYGEEIDSAVLEGLMKLDPAGLVKPNLAQSVTRPSPATYVYHLRHGVRFSDGTPLTSNDVATSINYQRYPGKGNAAAFADVKTIKPTDPHTVVVTLKHPDVAWQYSSAVTGVFEAKQFEANKPTFGQPGTLLVGTGPYKVDSLSPTTGAELSINPYYWGGKPAIQHVSFRFFADQQSTALAFRAGQVDLAFPSDARAWESVSGSKVLTTPSCQQGFLSINTVVPPFNNIHVRRAMAYAIDRAGLINAIGGFATPDYTMIPPTQLQTLASKAQVASLVKSLPTYQFDLTKAKAELAKSPYPHGFTTHMETYAGGSAPVVYQALAAMLAKIGITVNVNVVSIGEYVGKLSGTSPKDKGARQPLLASYYLCYSPDPGFVPSLALGTKNAFRAFYNFSGYANPKIDTLIQAGASHGPASKRFSIYSQLLKIIATDEPYVPLYVANNNVAVSSKFTFPTFNAYTAPRIPYILQIKPR